METKKKLISGGFLKGLGLYALILVLLIAVGLTFFYFFIRAYEETRPATAVQAYMEQLDEAYLLEHAQDFLSSLDSSVQSWEDGLAYICENLEGADYARRPGESDTSYTYVLRSGGKAFDTVTVTASEEKLFNFPFWQVTDEQFSLDVFCEETELTVPADYTVTLGGKVLSAENIVDDHVPYELLREVYNDGYDLPYMVTYHVGPYVGQMAPEVLDGAGNPVDGSALDEAFFTDNCTAEEKAAVEEFAQLYVERYVDFMGSHDEGTIAGTYVRLRSIVLEGSRLRNRLSQVMGLGFSTSTDSVESVTVNSTMNVGSGYYVCDVTYLVNTKGLQDMVTTTNNVKLVFLMTNDGFRACSHESY